MNKSSWLFFMILLGGCSIYRVPIVQGNYLRQDLIRQIKPGQTKAEVRDILGDTVLTSIDKENEWIYLYTKQEGSKNKLTYRMVIKFKANRVSKIYVQS